MQRAYIRALMLSIVLVSGLFMVAVDGAFADKGGTKGGQGEPQNCDKIKDPAKNPNCNGGNGNGEPTCAEPPVDTDGDLLCDGIDLCPFDPVGPAGQSPEDKDGDGVENRPDKDECNALIN